MFKGINTHVSKRVCYVLILTILCTMVLMNFPGVVNAAEAPMYEESYVWANTEDGYARHFNYGLAVTDNDTILVFCEGRYGTLDQDPHDILLKRSTNGGQSWGDDIVVVQSSPTGPAYGNPSTIIDSDTGRIFLFYNDANTGQVFCKTSTNDGVSWSGAAELTSLFNNDPYSRENHSPGPGHGIQLSNGRLMMQVWHRHQVPLPVEELEYGTSVIYSDNGGWTWQMGGYVSMGYYMNESRLIELNNGDIMLNARRINPEPGAIKSERGITISTDGGSSWGTPYFDTSMPVYVQCDSGMIRYDSSHIIFSRPNWETARRNLTISVSEDEGSSWAYNKVIHKAEIATYSDLAVMSDNTIVCVYGGASYVVCARMNLEYLKSPDTAYVYENENLTISASSGDSSGVYTPSTASGGATLEYLSNAVGDYVSQTVNIPVIGTYNVKVRHRVADNRAKVQLKIDGEEQGGEIDLYASTTGYEEFDLGEVKFNSTGNRTFTYEVVGKNASSSNYRIYADCIILTYANKDECEDLVVYETSGDTVTELSSGSASGGAVLGYNSDAVGDYISLKVYAPDAGKYAVKVRQRTAANRGRVQLKIDGVNQGSVMDLYSAEIDYREYDLGEVTFSSTGNKLFRFEVVGKNAQSTNYTMYPDCIVLTSQKINSECETLTISGSSGDVLDEYSDSSASGGATLIYGSNAVGDYLSMEVNVPVPGTYNLKVRHRIAWNRGQVQLKIDGVNQGGVVDPYSATAGYQEYNLGNVTFSTAGIKIFRFEIVGKNQNSGGYGIYPDSIILTQ